MARTVALVSCVKSKRAEATAAKDLYTSPLFRGMRAYAERKADAWLILSAEHGLVRPGKVLEPYERTLKLMVKADRLAWAERVQRALLRTLPPAARVIILAGRRYYEHLLPFLEQHGFAVEVPMKGLNQGRMRQWLKFQNDGGG